MNKIVVGTSPSPNVSKVQSKIGSLQNTSYKPKGGGVKIESKKLDWKAESKIGSMQNVKYAPGGGNVKVIYEPATADWTVGAQMTLRK
jgi:microtubule-associated protein tau